MGKSLTGRELGRGICQRKDGKYMARFTDRFGIRQTYYARTYTEITRLLRNAQYENEKLTNTINTRMTLNEWFDIWLKTCKANCRETTKRTYSVQYDRLRDTLGWVRLGDLKHIMVQQAFNNLKTDASRKSCKAILCDMLNCAMDADLLHKNVAIKVKTNIDGTEKPEKRILSDEEVNLLYSYSKDGMLYHFFVVALNTGMRMGEILGLCWDCVDFENNLISVERTLTNLPNDGKTIYELHKPKTSAGKRLIPMTKACKEALLEKRELKKEIEKKFPPKEGFEDLVFTSKTNQPLHAANIKDSINYLVARINNENETINFEHFTPHGLRHTFATNCIENGMKPKVLQKLLGHKSLQMTMDLYCHVREDTLKDEISLIGEMP